MLHSHLSVIYVPSSVIRRQSSVVPFSHLHFRAVGTDFCVLTVLNRYSPGKWLTEGLFLWNSYPQLSGGSRICGKGGWGEICSVNFSQFRGLFKVCGENEGGGGVLYCSSLPCLCSASVVSQNRSWTDID